MFCYELCYDSCYDSIIQASSPALLYQTKKSKKHPKPSPQDLEGCRLFHHSGSTAVSQGTEEETPSLMLFPSQMETLQPFLQLTTPWSISPVQKSVSERYPLHESAEDLLAISKLDPIFMAAKETKKGTSTWTTS